MEQNSVFCGLFVLKKSGNIGDKFPLLIQASTIDAEIVDIVWNKGFLWIKTDTAMESERRNFADSQYGDPDIKLNGATVGKLSDLFVCRVSFQKEDDKLVSNAPIFCATTKYQGKDVYLFIDCITDAILTAKNEASGEKSEYPVWVIPFSENHPDDYLSDDDDYDIESIRKWPIYLLNEEEAE